MMHYRFMRISRLRSHRRNAFSTRCRAATNDAIREAVRFWLEREHRLLALDTVITAGIADPEAGRVSAP